MSSAPHHHLPQRKVNTDMCSNQGISGNIGSNTVATVIIIIILISVITVVLIPWLNKIDTHTHIHPYIYTYTYIAKITQQNYTNKVLPLLNLADIL